MGENDDDEDDNDEGNAVAPPAPTAVPGRSLKKKTPWRWFLSKRPLWRMR
jgi:hypothetical protein